MASKDHVKTVVVDGINYRITDFDALSGGFVFMFVMKKVVPLLKIMEVDLASVLTMETNEGFGKIVEAVLPVLDSISKDDLQQFMSQCLEQVEIELPAGYEKVMRKGEFTVDAVKYSTKTAFLLCYHAIQGIVTDFFGEKALGFLKNINPKATKSRKA